TEIYHPADPSRPTVSRCLREAGYTLGMVGKFHAEVVGTPVDHGFQTFIPDGAYARWRQERGLPPAPSNGYFGEVDPHITPEQSRLAWGADHAIALLTAFAAGDRPFFIRWDPSEPHLSCRPPEPYASHYPPEAIPPWPSFADTLEGKPYIQAQQRRTWKVDGWSWEQWAPTVSMYLGEIALLDAQVGRLLDALDALGLADNTLVVYSTDHGDLCGGHGMLDKHFVLYDDVMRVPLIARFPGRLPAGAVCEAFISHALDLAATFCAVAGVTPPATFMGRDLVGTVRGEIAARPDIFGMWQGGQFGAYSQRMVRDRRWKYVWNCTAEDELYDLQSDPGELRNRARDPHCRAELDRLRARLVAWMESIGDPLCNLWTRPQLLEGLTY
ncbi:MAG TPA: sulfatase-like hydrolase/transferase, partial [Armatimonadota bacterium]|nr:sulfatase-like hydrolase/transferase [Armatimonadota bacterium]